MILTYLSGFCECRSETVGDTLEFIKHEMLSRFHGYFCVFKNFWFENCSHIFSAKTEKKHKKHRVKTYQFEKLDSARPSIGKVLILQLQHKRHFHTSSFFLPVNSFNQLFGITTTKYELIEYIDL